MSLPEIDPIERVDRQKCRLLAHSSLAPYGTIHSITFLVRHHFLCRLLHIYGDFTSSSYRSAERHA